jgi:hypothetical protein
LRCPFTYLGCAAMSSAGVDRPAATQGPQRRFGCLQVILFLAVAVLVTAALTLWVARTWFYPPPLEPVQLTVPERQVIDEKLQYIRQEGSPPAPTDRGGPVVDPDARGGPVVDPEARGEPLVPELYREDPQARVIHFTERELNGLIADNPDLARRVALHLSEDLVSATVLVTLPQDFPFMSGRTIRVNAGLGLRHVEGRPVVELRGISVMGVPLPSAWLGGLKGRDLVALHGGDPGIWQAFADGVADVRVEQGRLRVELAE